MNAITYRAAYSFFPILTFERRSMIPRTGNFEEVLGKYYVRGWKEPSFDGMVLESLDPLRQSEFGAGRRWPNDNRSWVFNFNISEIEKQICSVSRTALPLRVDPFSANSFNVDICLKEPLGPQSSFNIKNMTLKIGHSAYGNAKSGYGYTICRGLSYYFIRRFIAQENLGSNAMSTTLALPSGILEIPLFLFNKLYKTCHICNDAGRKAYPRTNSFQYIEALSIGTLSFYSSSHHDPQGKISLCDKVRPTLMNVNAISHELEDLGCYEEVSVLRLIRQVSPSCSFRDEVLTCLARGHYAFNP